MPLRAADSAAAAAEEICSADTPSYRALAREQGERGAYRQTRQNMIYFGSSRADTEAYIGAAGEPVGASEISGEGWTDTYETYHYSMRWFDSKVPMSTYYQYRNGFLERIELRPEETGYTGEQVRELIEAMYGSPVSEERGQTGWSDPIYSKYITLSRERRSSRHQRSGGCGGMELSVFDPPAGGQTEVGRVQPVYGRYQ